MKVDIFFCMLLALGGLGHIFGTLKFFQFGTDTFVWSLSGSLACFLIVAFNVLRIRHPEIVSISWIALMGSIGWVGISILFAHSIKSYADPRFLMHFIAALGLVLMSGMQLFQLG